MSDTYEMLGRDFDSMHQLAENRGEAMKKLKRELDHVYKLADQKQKIIEEAQSKITALKEQNTAEVIAKNAALTEIDRLKGKINDLEDELVYL